MSRRVATVEDFDDDTDIPLPSHALPNTGRRGPILEQIGGSDGEDDEDEDDDALDMMHEAGPASPSQAAFKQAQAQMRASAPQAMDMTPYKSWTCIYPIYIDAKRPYGTGTRRISRSKAVWWPLVRDISEALNRLQLRSVIELDKSHPQDWENPGRVRVQWKKEGQLVNSSIKTKKQLLETISVHIQRTKPDSIPREPYIYTSPSKSTVLALPAPTPKSKAKGKQTAGKPAPAPAPASEPTTASTPVSAADRKSNGRLARPPEPLPPLASRISPYSPALPANMLVETVKAGMSAAATEAAASVPGGQAGAPMKGKRKVVRVRQ